MGCKNSCCKGGEQNNEMIDGNLPEQEFNGEKKESEEEYKLKGINSNVLQKDYNVNYKRDTVESDISIVQRRNEEIFDFFNDLRSNPQNYLEESEKYKLTDIILSAIDKKNSDDSLNTNLIKNPFFNLFLDTNVKSTPYSKEDILNNIESNEQLQNYKKSLFIVESSMENTNEAVWNLLKNNKDIVLDEILFRKIDYFIVSSFFVPEKKIVMTYFLFLKKDYNK